MIWGRTLLRRFNVGAVELVNARTLFETRGYLMSEIKRVSRRRRGWTMAELPVSLPAAGPSIRARVHNSRRRRFYGKRQRIVYRQAYPGRFPSRLQIRRKMLVRRSDVIALLKAVRPCE